MPFSTLDLPPPLKVLFISTTQSRSEEPPKTRHRETRHRFPERSSAPTHSREEGMKHHEDSVISPCCRHWPDPGAPSVEPMFVPGPELRSELLRAKTNDQV